MTSHKIQHIDLQLLQEHIKSKISTSSNTITIYHFIIGSKAYENDFVLDLLLQSDRPRNHECPKIVENLLFNPDLQLSPDILSNDLNTTGNTNIKLLKNSLKKYIYQILLFENGHKCCIELS
jgi:hypothetical protein